MAGFSFEGVLRAAIDTEYTSETIYEVIFEFNQTGEAYNKKTILTYY